MVALGLWLWALACSAERRRLRRATGWTLLVLLLLTAVFDNLIIGVGLVAYEDTSRSGLQIGLAPIEDFSYSIAAALGLIAVWSLLDNRQQRRKR